MKTLMAQFKTLLPLIFFSCTANSADMPCTLVKQQILKYKDPLHPTNIQHLLDCLDTHRICLLNDDGKEVSSDSIREITNKNPVDSVTLGFVQSPPGVNALCLMGEFSGGSSATWIFAGWRIENGKIEKLKYMAKGELHSDAVPAKSLAEIIYDVYKKSGNINIDPRSQ